MKDINKYLSKNIDEKVNIIFIQNEILHHEIDIIKGMMVLFALYFVPESPLLFIEIIDKIFSLLLLFTIGKEFGHIKKLKEIIKEN